MLAKTAALAFGLGSLFSCLGEWEPGFAHTDLSGVALFEESFFHGLRAADEVADALATETPT